MINIAEKLKDCPKGTKLYSPMVGDVYLKEIVRKYDNFPIKCYNNIFEQISFTEEGKYSNQPDSECMLFPSKENRNWLKFQRPFKDGDIISNNQFISIFHKFESGHLYYHCWYHKKTKNSKFKIDFGIGYVEEYTYATDEEKQKLFKFINDKGYNWDFKTNTLKKVITPIFKVGDKITNKKDNRGWIKIATITDTYYIDEHCAFNIPIEKQDEWELYVDKFDPTTLIPFESKVLVRNLDGKWKPAIFAGYDSEHNNYYTIGAIPWPCCIPYEENKHLLFTYEDCDDYYKN